MRCSQPEVGWLGWRSTQDEVLLSAITAACKLNPGTTSVTNGKTGMSHSDRGLNVMYFDATIWKVPL